MKLRFSGILLLLVFMLGFSHTAYSKTFIHPGIPFTKSDLDLLKANILKEPWKSAYAALANDSRSQLTYTMRGPCVEVGRSPDINRNQWMTDMVAIHNLAFMWYFTGNTAYAKKATDMLDAWATTNTIWSGIENHLDIGDYAQYWGAGADILRGTYPGWTSANTTHVKNYFANVLFPTSWVPAPLRDHNKGAIMLKIALAASAFCDDSLKWEQSIECFRLDAGGGLRCSYANGEVADAGRDDHWYGQAEALIWCGEVAYKQGIDMFSELDRRLLAIGELYNHYAINPTGLAFIPIGGYSTYYYNWGLATGARHQGMLNNIIQGAYSVRKGIPTPWSDQMRSLVGEGAFSFMYYKSADTTTTPPLVPIPYATVETDTCLTNLDIGSTPIIGNALYKDGLWTVTEGGTSLANSLNYTFKPVSGNAAIIAKVESKTLAGSTVGVMIRESLDVNGKYVTINLPGTSGATSSASGPYTSKATTHSGPSIPWWVKVERIGYRLFAYHSPDGINWSSNGIYYMDVPAGNYYIGLYSLSNNTSQSNTTVFSHVSVTNSIPSDAPVIRSVRQLNLKKNTPFTYTTVASGSSVRYKATTLPAGLSLDTLTGVISGIPTTLSNMIVTLTATNGFGQGSAVLVFKVSNNGAPATISTITATVSNATKINLTWTSVLYATSYTVKRSLSATGPFEVVQAGLTGTSYLDPAPVPEVKNYYVVSSFAGDLESADSKVVYNSVPPAIPQKPLVKSNNGALTVSWNVVTGALSYNVKRSTVTGGAYTLIGTATTNSYVDANVTDAGLYYYVISAKGSALESSNSVEGYGVVGSANAYWSETPSGEKWSEKTNWLENGIPTSPSVLTFRASTDTILTNDLNDLHVSSILFDSAAVSPYTLAGNGITLRHTLINISPAAHTLNIPIALDTTLLVFTNTNAVYLTNTISGKGSLSKNGGNVLEMSGANTYSGNTTIYGTSGGWPPHNAIGIKGVATGTQSVPTSGPLGIGKIFMNGGSLYTPADATLYNDIEVPAGKTGYFYQTGGAMILKGKLLGSGTINDDGNNYGGVQWYGDNSQFTGTFVTLNRSGMTRCRFGVPQAGSAKAIWNFSNVGSDGATLWFTSGTISFGEIWGSSGFRASGGSPVISIGAKNTNCTYGGYFQNSICLEKVGTGTLTLTGKNTHTGTTTVKQGTLLLNNASSVYYASPIVVAAGTFGGTGYTSATVTIGTTTGDGAIFSPAGTSTIGTFTSSSSATMNGDATFQWNVNGTDGSADKFLTNGIVLKTPKLLITNIGNYAFPLGTNMTLIDNTATTAVTGTFKDLPEMAQIKIGVSYAFRITYKGGTGNDVILLDERKLPATITSALTDTANIGEVFSYAITGMNKPVRFSATGLPDGLALDTLTGIISGIPTTIGTYTVALSASNTIGTGVSNLVIKVLQSTELDNAILEKSWKVYPTQVMDDVHLVFTDASKMPERIQLIQWNGQIKLLDLKGKTNAYTYSMRDFAPGIYFLRIVVDKTCSVKKIVKL